MTKKFHIHEAGQNSIVLELPSGKELVLTETIKEDGESNLQIISQMTDHDTVDVIKECANSVNLKLHYKIEF